MSRPIRRGLAAIAACCSIVFVPVVLAAGPTPEAAVDATTERVAPPSQSERRMGAELRDLARAWADGGGTFGYPFWEKAGQRWHDRQITTSMYREYVTGYRDRLVVGCDLLEQVEVEAETSREVRELVIDSCERRVEALRAQKRWLDEQVRREGNDPDLDLARSDERIDEYQTEAREALQESYRLARVAMDLAQAQLDRSGIGRLPEDAFI